MYAVQFIFNKGYQKRAGGSFHSGIWMSLVSSLAMLAYLLPGRQGLTVTVTSLLCAVIYGADTLFYTVMAMYVLRFGKVSDVTTYSLMGPLVLPFLTGIIVWNERLTPFKTIGVGILFLAMLSPLLMDQIRKKKEGGSDIISEKKTRISPIVFFCMCICLFLSNGLLSLTSTITQKVSDPVPPGDYLVLCKLVTALGAALILLCMGIRHRRAGDGSGIKGAFYRITADGKEQTGKNFGMEILCAALYAVCNGLANLLSLQCSRTMDASIQFPIICASIILTGPIMGRIFFREKIAPRDIPGLLLAAGGSLFFLL